MLKKLTATAIVGAAATGVMLLGGPANADRVSAGQKAAPADLCYVAPGVYQQGWCNDNPTTGYYPPTTYFPPTPYYPGYGWDRWHHGGGWNRYPGHWHR